MGSVLFHQDEDAVRTPSRTVRVLRLHMEKILREVYPEIRGHRCVDCGEKESLSSPPFLVHSDFCDTARRYARILHLYETGLVSARNRP